MEWGLSMLLDVLIVLLLAGTIFYAARLSSHIKIFRDSRKELEGLIADLSVQVSQAERAIAGLRENARESGRDLQERINQAQALSDELQFMSQSGDSLAGRLEKLAEKSARTHAPLDLETPLSVTKSETVRKPVTEKRKSEPFAGFAIRDPEFDADLDGAMGEDGLMAGDFDDEDETGLQSRAERDLYEALQGKRKMKTGAGGV